MSFVTRTYSDPSLYYRELRQESEVAQSLFTLERAGINRGGVDWNFHESGASYHRIYYNFDLGSSIRIDNRDIALTPKHVFFIPAGTTFTARTKKPVRHSYIEFNQTPFTQRLAEYQAIEATPTYIKLFGEFHRAVSLEDEGGSICLALAILHLAGVDLHMRSSNLPEEFNALLTAIPRNKFRDTDASLAGRLGFSPQRFRRWFISHMKISPARYIRRAQVAEAGKLLRSSEKPIEHIAEESGFPDRFYFTRVFTREMGMGPGEYRRRATSTVTESVPTLDLRKRGSAFVPPRVPITAGKPLQLTPYFNRRWQGPEAWFNDHPLKFHGGKRNILGIPFHLAERDEANRAVLLHSQRIPKSNGRNLPTHVTVPVRKKVDAIYILHACGWVTQWAHIADYEFIEDDNISITPIVAAANRGDSGATIADWYATFPSTVFDPHSRPYPLPVVPGEHEPILYVFRWQNPRPHIPLREITFRATPDSQVPLALLAVTALLYQK